MEIIVREKLIVKNPEKAVAEYCRDRLVLDNPDYYKKERLGKWTGDTPKTISLYERDGADLWLPFGCLNDLWKMHTVLEDYDFSRFLLFPRVKYESGINLYPYQKKAVEAALKGKNGLIVMPCGAGKTQVGMEIIARLQCRTLWLTHTQDLLNQSKARAESVLTVDGTIGTITAGKVNIGTHITFATVQTMAKIDSTLYKDCFDCLIVDECQHCAGSPTRVTQFYKVVSSICCRYKFGLTATPKRSDGLQRSMFALLGDKLHEVTREEVAETTCPVKVISLNTRYTPDYDAVLNGDGTLNYSLLVDAMCENEDRLEMVSVVINEFTGPSMVLANRVKYLQALCERAESEGLRCVCLSGKGQSKKAKEERKAALRMLNDGELDIVFATYQLAKEGLDVPNLLRVFFATPEQDETTVIQSVGRVGRKAEGKPYGIVYDFIDDFGMYRSWAKKRKGYYKKIGAEVRE